MATKRRGLRQRSKPPQPDQWAEVERVRRALQESGRVPDIPERQIDMSPRHLPIAADPWKFDSPLYSYIRTLPAPVDGDRVVKILVGLDPTQRVGLPLIVNTVRRLQRELPLLKERAKQLRWIRQRYQGLRRVLDKDGDLLRTSTRDSLRQDIDAILVALNMLGPRKVEDRPLPKMGMTVRAGVDITRNKFWTKPIVAPVDYLKVPLGGDKPAHRAVAHLLHLAFGFPKEPRKVELRVYHSRRMK